MFPTKNIRSTFRNSVRIFRLDLSKIFSNWVSMVVIGGIIFLPSLYAWFNIYASWDPYGNTGHIKVAIVNEDTGGSIKDTKVNIGESVVKSLMENQALGWTFYETREEGLKEVEKGAVYATLIIPFDFSKKIVTLVDTKPIKPELEYYVNEKINAIAPKITDKGATTIQNQITSSFVETVADKIIDIMHSVGVELGENYPTIQRIENMTLGLGEHLPQLESTLDTLAQAAKEGPIFIQQQDEQIIILQRIIGELIGFNEAVSESLKEIGTRSDEIIPAIKEDLVLIQNIFKDISSTTSHFKEVIELNKPVLISDIEASLSKIESTKERLQELANKSGELDQGLGEGITNIANGLNTVFDDYVNTLAQLKQKLEQMKEAQGLLDHLVSLDQTVTNEFETIRKQVNGKVQQIEEQLSKLEQLTSQVENLYSTEETTRATEEGTDDNTDSALIKKVDELVNFITELQQVLNENTALYSDAIHEVEDLKNGLLGIKTLFEKGERVELSSVKTMGRGLSDTIRSIRTLLEVRTANITDNLSKVEGLQSEVNNSMQTMRNTIANVASGGQEKLDEMIEHIYTIQDKLAKVTEGLIGTTHDKADQFQNKVEAMSSGLTKLQTRLNSLKGMLQDNTEIENILQDISALTYSIGASLDSALDLVDDDLIAKLNEQIGKMDSFVTEVTELLNHVQEELVFFRKFGEKLATGSELLESDLLEIKAHVPLLQERLDHVNEKIKLLNANIDIGDLIGRFTQDNRDKSDFLASPVVLNTTILYPMGNYGTGLTPFYTTLCLWVGALLLTALLTTTAHNADFDYTPREEYFGKYYLFGSCALLQGFIASLGDILVLGVRPQHPVLFILLAMLYSAVFTAIVYTFVALFSNIGKAIGIVLLVIQLGGAGGTFPIQVTPLFFQRVHSFLPFTYGISGMREAIAGIYRPTFIQDILIICLFGIGILIIGMLFKERANKFLHEYSKQLGDSGVIGH